MKRYVEEEFIVEGDRGTWFEKCRVALSKLTKNPQLRQSLWEMEGQWAEWLPPHDESIKISLFPAENSRTRIHIKAGADISVDWIVITLGYGASLHHKVSEKFKNALG